MRLRLHVRLNAFGNALGSAFSDQEKRGADGQQGAKPADVSSSGDTTNGTSDSSAGESESVYGSGPADMVVGSNQRYTDGYGNYWGGDGPINSDSEDGMVQVGWKAKSGNIDTEVVGGVDLSGAKRDSSLDAQFPAESIPTDGSVEGYRDQNGSPYYRVYHDGTYENITLSTPSETEEPLRIEIAGTNDTPQPAASSAGQDDNLDIDTKIRFDETAAEAMLRAQIGARSLADNLPPIRIADNTPDASPTPSPDTADAADQSQDAGRYNFHANAAYGPALSRAARRNGFDPAQVAALVNAEAGRNRAGVWNPNAHAGTSSAVGLTQYLDRTWIDVAQRPGTTLNNIARQNGWLGDDGRVTRGSRRNLLALRNNPDVSIATAAEDLRHHIAELDHHGLIPPTATADERIQYGYIAHHEGIGGARAFLNGRLSNDRATTLLNQQIGSARADAYRQNYPNPRAAYENWLWQYTRAHVVPQFFRR